MGLWSVLLVSVASSGVCGAIVVAFGKFLGDRSNEHLRAEIAKEFASASNAFELEVRQLQSLLDRRHFVSRAQFDAEFLAMKEVFGLLAEVRLVLPSIRLVIDHMPPDGKADAFNERLKKRLEPVARTHDKLLSAHENLRPFYSDELYEALASCMLIVCHEISGSRQVSWNSTPSPDWYFEGQKNCADFRTAYMNVLTVIRVRMRQMYAE